MSEQTPGLRYGLQMALEAGDAIDKLAHAMKIQGPAGFIAACAIAELTDFRKQVAALIRVGSGEVPHTFMGLCPDSLNGSSSRDDACPACQVLQAGEGSIASDV